MIKACCNRVGSPTRLRGKDSFSIKKLIATRDFAHTFKLADQVNVVGSTLDNGLLNIALVRVIPEALKPRKITIGSGDNVHALEQRKAA